MNDQALLYNKRHFKQSFSDHSIIFFSVSSVEKKHIANIRLKQSYTYEIIDLHALSVSFG